MKQLLWLSIIGLLLIGCTQQESIPLRVATNVWPGYEPLYLAKEMNMYANDLVELVELPNATEVIRAYRNGFVDGAAITLDEALLLTEQQTDFSILLITDYSHGGDVILARPPINALHAIRGHNVGVENSALGAYVISRALEINNIKPHEITIVPVYVDEHEQAYDKGKVDVVVTFEPVRTKLLEKGANLIFDSSQMPKEIVDILIVRNHFLEKHPQSVRALLTGWFAALNLIQQDPDSAYTLIAKRLGMSKEETQHSYEGLLLPDLAENKKMLLGRPAPLLTTIEKLADNMIAAKILKKKNNYQTIFLSEDKMGLYP